MSRVEPVKPCLVAFAMREELDPFAAATPWYDEIDAQRIINPFEVNHKFRSEDTLVAIAGPMGVGRRFARKWVAEQLEILDAEFVLSAGLSGGLRDGLSPGTLCVAGECVREGGEPIVIPRPWVDALLEAVPGAVAGRLLTVDAPLLTPEAKRAAAARHDAIAVDMETHAVAEVAAERGIPFVALRIISDAADESLPPDVGLVAGGDTLATRMRIALRAALNPGRLRRLLRLRKRIVETTSALARASWTAVDHLRTRAPDLRPKKD